MLSPEKETPHERILSIMDTKVYLTKINILVLPHQHFPQQKQQDQYLKTFQEIALQFL